MTIQTTCSSCSYTQVMAANCCECGNSLRPAVPENILDLVGDEVTNLAEALNAYEASIQTPAQKAFMRLVSQHAKGLITATDLWAETVMTVLGTEPDALFPPAPVITKTLVGSGPTSTYRMTDQDGTFLGYSAKA